jgi:uncharacterized protein YjiS (DUF1127 family)
MSTQTLNAYPATAADTGLPGGLFARVMAWIDERRRYRRTLAELSQLTDRELEDIGISRVDIGTIARECALSRR